MKKLLVRKILEKANNYKWSLQGLGMLRLYLSDEVRLHVWDSMYKLPNVSPLHDHPWDFESEVIAGEVQQYLYREIGQRVFKADESEMFNCATIKCGANACTVSGTVKVNLEKMYQSFKEGEQYTQYKDEIHESFPLRGTVTVVNRTFGSNRDNARVFWRGDGGFVSAEPRPATETEVTRITSYALARWF